MTASSLDIGMCFHREAPAADVLLAAGFTRGYKGLVARVDRRAASAT